MFSFVQSVIDKASARARDKDDFKLEQARVRAACTEARKNVQALREQMATLNLSRIPGGIANHEPLHDPPLVLPESPLAHALLDGLCGLEIGAAAHNPFGLNTRNVGISAEMELADFEVYKAHQMAFCSTWSPIDIPGYADLIPVADSSQDFVIHSHVWEHLPNPLRALEEWVRVVRRNGFIYGIVPKRDAAGGDAEREVTPLRVHIMHYLLNLTPAERAILDNVPNRGHYTVFDGQALTDIEVWFNLYHREHLRRVAYQETDDKVGNGHAIAWQVIKRGVPAVKWRQVGKG